MIHGANLLLISALQVLWLSLAGIGLASLLAARQIKLLRFQATVLTRILKASHPIVAFVGCFALGVFLFILPIAIGYLFELPLALLELCYLFSLALSIYLLWGQRRSLEAYVRAQSAVPKRELLFVGAMVLLIALEFILALLSGADLTDDTPVHVAHMQLSLSLNHLTLADPYLGFNDIIDARYSTNVLQGIEVVFAKLLHVQAYRVWEYSYAFHRLLLGLSIFTLAKVFLDKHVPKQWPYYLIILLPYFNFTYIFHYAELPHSVAIAWACLLIVGFKLLFEYDSWLVVLVAASLISTTHATNATYTIVFLTLLIGIMAPLKRLTKRQLSVLVAAIIILSPSVIYNAVLPSRSIANAPYSTSGHGLHQYDLYTRHWGKLTLPDGFIIDHGQYHRPNPTYFAFPIDPGAIGASILCIGLVVLFKQLKSSKIKYLALLLLAAVFLGTYNVLYASTVCYLYLLRVTKNKHTRLLLILTILFFAIVAYNPIVLTVAHNRFPLMVLARFEDFNAFMFVAPIMGVFLLYRYVARYWNISHAESGVALFVLMLTAGFILFRFPLNTSDLLELNKSEIHQNTLEYQGLNRLKPLALYAENQVIYTDDASVNQLLPIVSSHPVGEVFNTQSDQKNDQARRRKCSMQIDNELKLEDLTAAKATRVILTNPHGKNTLEKRYQVGVGRLAQAKPYLKVAARLKDYTVYDVVKPAGYTHSTGICAIPYGQ